MLGIRTDYDGLVIDPCIPSAWKEYEIMRSFRGCSYKICVKNPDGVQKGVKKILVDGNAQESNLVKPFTDGHTHCIEVVMGLSD